MMLTDKKQEFKITDYGNEYHMIGGLPTSFRKGR